MQTLRKTKSRATRGGWEQTALQNWGQTALQISRFAGVFGMVPVILV
jgi:hypothetical protein